MDSPLVPEQLTCWGCKRIFKISRTLKQHSKSCAWIKQSQREASKFLGPRIEDIEIGDLLSTEENLGSAFESAQNSINQNRQNSGNDLLPYPTLTDAVVGLVRFRESDKVV